MHENQNKNPNLLSVVVSCKGLLKVLRKNLSALSRQNLNQELWDTVFLLKEGTEYSDCVFLIKDHFPSHKLLFLPKDKPFYEMRNLGLQNINHHYIYFIDEDVILDNPGHLKHVVELHKKFPEVTVIGGSYLDHPDCTFWGRSYNWVARLWTKHQANLVPAGNLSVKTNRAFKSRFYSPNQFGFGGEEVYFLHSLKKEGHKSVWKEELNTSHLALHSLKDFIKRAWFQGASLAFEKEEKKISYTLFLKEKASFLIKTFALFYLLLVRFSCFFYRMKRK